MADFRCTCFPVPVYVGLILKGTGDPQIYM